MSIPQIRTEAIEAVGRKILMEYDPSLLSGQPCPVPIETIIETKFDLMLVNIIDRALLRLKRYPDRGELYYEILTKQFIYRFNSTEKELLEELNIERSVFYDRKREAIYLFSVCLFGYSIPEVLEELPRLNPD